MQTKRCCRCKHDVQVELFSKDKSSKDGLQSFCKQCNKEYQQTWYENNREKHLANGKKYREENPEKVKLKNDTYKANNPDKVKMTGKRWYENNKDRRIATCVIWNAANKTKRATYSHNRRTKKAGIPGSHTKDDIDTLYVKQAAECVYCGTSLIEYFEIDHVIPVTREGCTNSVENLQLTCKTCNRSKNNKTHEEFLVYLQTVDQEKYQKYLNQADKIQTIDLLSNWR